MVDIQPAAAEIRRGIKEEEEEDRRRRKKLQGKNIMPPLLHRAAITRQPRIADFVVIRLLQRGAATWRTMVNL